MFYWPYPIKQVKKEFPPSNSFELKIKVIILFHVVLAAHNQWITQQSHGQNPKQDPSLNLICAHKNLNTNPKQP